MKLNKEAAAGKDEISQEPNTFLLISDRQNDHKSKTTCKKTLFQGIVIWYFKKIIKIKKVYMELLFHILSNRLR